MAAHRYGVPTDDLEQRLLVVLAEQHVARRWIAENTPA
jgi:hypothetical protein